MSQTLHCVKKLDYLCNCKSEISNVCNEVEGHCLQAMKIVHHYANSCFDWLISGHQSVNPISPGGGADSDPPWETFLNNSKTAQDIKMKFFKFNLTLMGVILHMMTILINLRCCHGNLLLLMCRGIEK